MHPPFNLDTRTRLCGQGISGETGALFADPRRSIVCQGGIETRHVGVIVVNDDKASHLGVYRQPHGYLLATGAAVELRCVANDPGAYDAQRGEPRRTSRSAKDGRSSNKSGGAL